MGKPRMIILIRHAQSEGNKNREIHQTVPDHRVKLTQEGWSQARDAGRRLRALLRPDDTLHFFTSPYRRTRETTEGILQELTSDEPSPSPFPRQTIKVYEEPRLREQDFGNFQPCSAEMERMWQERADYGHFFYRIPNGESAADAYDRISGFNESLWRYFGEDDFASVCVLVTHGLMTRVFLMKWYHFSVEYFEDLRNVNHCEFVIMKKTEDSGKYLLETHLRTWSELRRERREAALSNPALMASLPKFPTLPHRKKWGGCPDGCNHHFPSVRHPSRRQNTNDLIREDFPAQHVEQKFAVVVKEGDRFLPNEDEDDPRGRLGKRAFPSTSLGLHIDIRKSCDDIGADSPTTTPSFISLDDRVGDESSILSPFIPGHNIGRDGGGSASGFASSESSDTAEQDSEQKIPKRSMAITASGEILVGSGMTVGVQADQLGDRCQSQDKVLSEDGDGDDCDEDLSQDVEETETAASLQEAALERALDMEEIEEKSVQKSVY